MKTIISIYLLFAVTGYAQAGQNETDCNEVISQLSSVMNASTSKASLSEISATNPDLLVIGEFHYDHLFWKMPHVYSYFKNLVPRVNCLYSEISQDGTDAEIQEMIAGNKNALFYSNRRLGFGPLYQSIYAQGDNLVLVDAPRPQISFIPDEDTMATWLTRRDSYMINRIKTSLESSECSAGVYNVGAQHIWDNLRDSDLTYDSFGSRVKKEVRTIVIDKGADPRLEQCEWQGVKSFIAPASNPQVRAFFQLDNTKSSADYVLYLRSIDIMHTLTQED